MVNVIEKVKEHLQKSRRSWAPNCNYASQVGHPCARNLVYQRLNWQEKLLPEPTKLMIFREGNMHEEAIMQLLRESGITVIEQQRPFEWKELQVRGRIDGRIKENGRAIPLEVKSSNSYDFEKIQSVEDLKDSPKFWVRGYYDQFQLYLFMMNEPDGIMIVKDKQSGRLKQITIEIDYEYAEKIAKKLEVVNDHVARETYPERISDRTVCQYCDFRHICLPDEESDSIDVVNDAELLGLLEERESLKASAKSYEQVDKKLKGYWGRMNEGAHLVGGKFQVKITTSDRAFYNVPADVKNQYKEAKPVTKTTITKLK